MSENGKELLRKLEQARRLSSVATDNTTHERLIEYLKSLEDELAHSSKK